LAGIRNFILLLSSLFDNTLQTPVQGAL